MFIITNKRFTTLGNQIFEFMSGLYPNLTEVDIEVIPTDLTEDNVFGWTLENNDQNEIEIHNQLSDKDFITTLIHELIHVGWPAIILLSIIIFVARPISVFVSSLGSNLSINEKLMIAWIGPGGIVAAAISSLVVLLHFTLNIFLASKKFDIKIILKSPSTYAVIIAVAFLYLTIRNLLFLVS